MTAADKERRNVEDAFRVRNEAENIVRTALKLNIKQENLKNGFLFKEIVLI
jgi:hypothetical protein